MPWAITDEEQETSAPVSCLPLRSASREQLPTALYNVALFKFVLVHISESDTKLGCAAEWR